MEKDRERRGGGDYIAYYLGNTTLYNIITRWLNSKRTTWWEENTEAVLRHKRLYRYKCWLLNMVSCLGSATRKLKDQPIFRAMSSFYSLSQPALQVTASLLSWTSSINKHLHKNKPCPGNDKSWFSQLTPPLTFPYHTQTILILFFANHPLQHPIFLSIWFLLHSWTCPTPCNAWLVKVI